jgi:sirohydrochlorin ferrochelatase
VPVVHGVLNGAPSVEAAVSGFSGRWLLVNPFFMSDGYFVKRALPERLAAAGFEAPEMLTPLGLLPGLVPLVARQFDGRQPAAILIAGHGSAKGDRSRLATEAFAAALGAALGVPARSAFLEEAPFFAEAAHDLADGEAVVSFFAGDGAHARDDVPGMLRAAGKADCPVVGPVGDLPGVADLITADVRLALAR